MKPYPKYKNSGVEWLGEVPEHWKHKKLSLLADRTTDFVASGSFQSLRENVKYLDEPNFAMLVRTTDLSNRRNVEQVYIDKKSYDFLSNSNLFGGEIILPNIGSVGDVYIYTPLYAHATLAPNAIMLEMNGSNRYYYYVFQDKKVNSALSLIGNEAVQVKFNKTQLRNLVLHAPPLQEQQTIANYLDLETTHIDSLIKEKENFISLLKEKRQALISHAVTKGLDPTVKMKDSGVEWLGEVPEHWDVSKLRYVFSFGKGLTITKANLQDKGIPCVNYGEIHSKYGFEVDASKHDLKYVDESYLISDRSSFLGSLCGWFRGLGSWQWLVVHLPLVAILVKPLK
jgi:type I restriction enzyme S subunit